VHMNGVSEEASLPEHLLNVQYKRELSSS